MDGIKKIRRKVAAKEIVSPEAKPAENIASAPLVAPRVFANAQNLKTDAISRSFILPWLIPAQLAERAKQKRRKRELALAQARQAKEEKLKQKETRAQQLITEQPAAEAPPLAFAAEKERQEKIRRAKNRLRAAKLALRLKAKEEKKKLKLERRAARQKELAKKIKKIKKYFKRRAKTIALASAAILACLIIIIGCLAYLVYSRPASDNLVTILVNRLPFPALIVNGRPIRYSTYLNELRLWGDYYASETGGQAVDKKQLVREKLIYYNILKKLAVAYGVKITGEEKEAAFKQLAASAGGEDKLADNIYNEYGLTKEMFIDKIIYYQALTAKIKRAFIEDDKLHPGATLRLGKVLALLQENKDDFETLAQKYSEDVHALQGGDIGYIKTSAMSNALKDAAQNLAIGDVSGAIKAEDKYFIAKIYDRKTSRQQEEEIWLKQITIFTNYDFEKYLTDLRQQAKVWTLIK